VSFLYITGSIRGVTPGLLAPLFL